MSGYLLIYLGLLFFLIIFEVKRFKYTLVDALTFFHVFFALKYLFPAIFWAWFPESQEWQSYGLKYNAATQPFVLFTMVFTYGAVISAFCLFMRVNFRYLLIIKLNSSLMHYCKLQAFFSVFVILLVFLAAYIEGGVVAYIKKGLAVRYFSSESSVSQYLKYFLYPVSIWFVALLAIYLNKNIKYKFGIFILMCLFFMATILFTLSLGGRAAIIYIFLNLILYLLMFSRKIKVLHVLIMFLVVLLVVLIMSYFRELTFLFLSDGELSIDTIDSDKSGVFESLLSVFSYYKHYFFTINEFANGADLYEYPRLGLDTLRAFVSLIPGVSFVNDLDVFGLTSNVSEINKAVIGGYTGYIPPGWVGMALIDGGVVWLLLKSLFIGASAAFINKSFINFSCGDSIVLYFYYFIITLWNYFFFLQEPFSIAQQSLGYYLYILFLLPILRIGFTRKN